MSFDYRLTSARWAAAWIEIGTAAVNLVASCIFGDPLADLTDGLARLRANPGTTRVSWPAEPGEHRWILTRTGEDVTVCILHFAVWSHRAGDDDGTILLAETCSMDVLDRAVRRPAG